MKVLLENSRNKPMASDIISQRIWRINSIDMYFVISDNGVISL